MTDDVTPAQAEASAAKDHTPNDGEEVTQEEALANLMNSFMHQQKQLVDLRGELSRTYTLLGAVVDMHLRLVACHTDMDRPDFIMLPVEELKEIAATKELKIDFDPEALVVRLQVI